MLTLAIDCSARFCSVALHEDDGDLILAQASPEIGRGHAERLPEILQLVLDAGGVNLARIDRIGVTIGPGSFAGIRVGVAFARGLALALDVPVVGVGSLEAIALPAVRRQGRPLIAVMDARRDRVWTLVSGPGGVVLEQAAEMTPRAAAALALDSGYGILGSGAALLVELEPGLAAGLISDIAAPQIADVARLAAALDPGVNPAEPRYLRDADAKPQAGFAVPREA